MGRTATTGEFKDGSFKIKLTSSDKVSKYSVFFKDKKIGTKTKYFSYYRCVCFLLLFIWNFNCNRYWLYKHNIISSPNFYNSILWYDKWTNRYHTKPCFICSFGLFLTITV